MDESYFAGLGTGILIGLLVSWILTDDSDETCP